MNYGTQVSLTRADVAILIGETIDLEAWKEADLDAANERIADLQEQLKFLRSADMGDLVKRPEFLVDYDDQAVSLAAVAESLLTRGLAFELVKANFIDRSFTLYTSTFHGDRVSPAATNYIIHHVERGLMDEQFELGAADVDAVIRERGTQALADPALYNIAILDHLLGTKKPAAKVMIAALARLEPDARRFLQSYLTAGCNAEELVARLAASSPRLLTYLVSEAELDDASRRTLVSACLGRLSDQTKQRVDDAVKQYLLANYANLPAVASAGLSAQAALRLAALFRDAGIILPELTPLSERVRRAFVRLGSYEMSAANLRAALGEGVGLALDEVREASREHVYSKALSELPAYLATIDGQSPSNTTEAGFATIISEVHGAAPALINELIAAASPASRIVDLDDVPEEAWKALAREGRFPATYANVTRYLAHAEGVDDAIGVVLTSEEAISELDGVEEPDKLELALTLIAASAVLGPVIRAKLAGSLKLKDYVPASSLLAEDGVLYAELISRSVVQENAATYRHLSSLSWSTKETVLGVSPTFVTWVTPELVGADLGQLLASRSVNDDARRAIVERADEYVSFGGRRGSLELAHHAVAMGIVVSFPVVTTMAANQVPPAQVLVLLRPYLTNASDAQLFAILGSLGGDYAQLAYAGRDKPKILNSLASIALLESLKRRGVVASFDPAQNPVKVNKRHK